MEACSNECYFYLPGEHRVCRLGRAWEIVKWHSNFPWASGLSSILRERSRNVPFVLFTPEACGRFQSLHLHFSCGFLLISQDLPFYALCIENKAFIYIFFEKQFLQPHMEDVRAPDGRGCVRWSRYASSNLLMVLTFLSGKHDIMSQSLVCKWECNILTSQREKQ